jgi:hypothetical protein
LICKEDNSNDVSTAEMSRLTVPIKSFVQSDLVVDPEFSSEQFTMSLNKSAIAPVGSLPLHEQESIKTMA